MLELDAKYSEPGFLFFWRKFNTLYNMMRRSEGIKDPIEVYFGILHFLVYTFYNTHRVGLATA